MRHRMPCSGDLPLVALVDAETANTAEWLAAALQDNHRAVLVGTATQRRVEPARAASRLP